MSKTNETRDNGGMTLIMNDNKRGGMTKPGLSSRHRFTTRMSLILTIVTIILFGILSLIYGGSDQDAQATSSLSVLSSSPHPDENSRSARWLEEDDNNNGNENDYSHYSCRYIYEEVSEAEDLCNYAKTCNDGEGVWAPWVFCSSTMSVNALFAILSPVTLLWLAILFRLLGTTAEDFFSPSLEMFSHKLGLPPRFAGVTLLALGNGAADVSATISAIVSDEQNGYKLSLGALTGAAMLVGGVVSGIIVLVADGVKCRGALMRDVTALMVTVVIVWINLSDGVVTRSNTTMFFGLYGFFVFLVLGADIYHRVVVLPRMRAVAAAVADAEQRAAGTANGLESNTERSTNVQASQPNFFMRFVTSFSNYDNPPNSSPSPLQQGVGVRETPETLESTSQPQADFGTPTPPTPAIGNRAVDGGELVADEEPFVVRSQREPSSNLELDTDDGGGNYMLVEDHIDRVCVGEGSPGAPAYNWIGAYHDGKQEILVEMTGLWNEISSNEGDLKLYERFFLLCELPFTLSRKTTIPIPCEGYYNRGFVALSVALSPIWFMYYLKAQHDIELWSKTLIPYFMGYFGFSIIVGILVLRFAPGGEGNMSLIAATPIAFYGFVMAAAWIDYVADSLVSVLDFIGIVLHIPGSIMGLTILAW
eukprot:CAMPEP_0197177934 /NCGR_PEP_ID=MMETSP1423-20130617/3359_1 /TAXON_ID=476441 /ORGANISM="Pseudo-nitzschia heimii, Strain UNC1101" /LENGTH=647 /DNA_ID=CAMNT_0042627559 /DNA_START=155 /DNA_END=2095 /DNA_ORIENTATION=-